MPDFIYGHFSFCDAFFLASGTTFFFYSLTLPPAMMRPFSPLSGEAGRRWSFFRASAALSSSNDLSARKSLMVDEVERTDSLAGMVAAASGDGACVEPKRFGLGIGNGGGHGEVRGRGAASVTRSACCCCRQGALLENAGHKVKLRVIQI